jgi:hypothetical protein
MIKTSSWLFVVALVLAVGGSAQAQTATCPSGTSNRIFIDGVDLFDTATSYEIYFGNTSTFGLTAVVKRNGTCLSGSGARNVLKGTTNLGSALPSGSNNLCLGGNSAGTRVNTITWLGSNLTVCGTALTAFNYAGNQFSTFGGTGATTGVDRLFGGNGIDIQHGNSGNDTVGGWSGDFDQVHGGNGDDNVGGTGGTASGAFTLNRGNANNDWLGDRVGFQDTLDGGTGNDLIDAQCNQAIIICGDGTDTIWHPPHNVFIVPNPTNCETDLPHASC